VRRGGLGSAPSPTRSLIDRPSRAGRWRRCDIVGPGRLASLPALRSLGAGGPRRAAVADRAAGLLMATSFRGSIGSSTNRARWPASRARRGTRGRWPEARWHRCMHASAQFHDMPTGGLRTAGARGHHRPPCALG
jgi:hypothetical protein